MPTINLTDHLGVDVSAELNEDSGIAKYLKGLTKLKFDGLNFENLKNITLDQSPVNSLETGVTFTQPIAVAGDSEIMIEAGVSGSLKLFSAKDEQLFDPEVFADPIPINTNQFYLGLGTNAKFGLEFADSGFGLNAGSGLGFATYRLFEKDPADAAFPTCLDALKETVAEFVIASDINDLKMMRLGTVATMEGSGSLKFSGELDVVSVVNPLAAINLPEPLGTVAITSGGSIKVGASFELSGAFQIRAHKVGADKVRLGYYRRRGTEFGLKVNAAIGLSVAIGNFEPLEQILKLISSDPKADLEKLKVELGEDDAEAIKKVVEAGISRKLEIAFGFELASQNASDAAFLFELELNKLDEEGRTAIHKALVGDLSHLPANQEKLPAGVGLVRSILTEVKKKKHTVKFNLLGIYNFISVSTLILKGRVMFEPSTGELVITDTATASKISASTLNFAADGQKLRKVLAESVLISAAYRCSKLVTQPPELKIAHSYFELHTKTDQTVMKNNLDVFEALGLMKGPEKTAILTGTKQFGQTTLHIETAYDDKLTNTLFLNNDQPRSRTEYELAGRKALALLVQAGEKDEFRRRAATDDALWKEMSQLGQPSFPTIAKLKNLSKAEVALVETDYTVIMWWAESMKDMSEQLAEVRQFLLTNPGADPKGEPFTKLRNRLGSKLREVASKTKSQFGDPWGLVAMDLASGQRASAEALLNGPTVALRRERS